jgi:hypothetical protein
MYQYLVHERVHRQRHEVAEHDLDHRPQAGHGAAERGARQRELGDGRVDHAAGAEALPESRRDGEHAAGGGHVLAEEEHALVALELVGQRLADRGAEVERHGAYSRARVMAASG